MTFTQLIKIFVILWLIQGLVMGLAYLGGGLPATRYAILVMGFLQFSWFGFRILRPWDEQDWDAKLIRRVLGN